MNVKEAAIKIIFCAEEIAEVAEKERIREVEQEVKDAAELLAIIAAGSKEVADRSVYAGFEGAPEDHRHYKALVLRQAQARARRAKARVEDLKGLDVLEKQLDQVCRIIGADTE